MQCPNKKKSREEESTQGGHPGTNTPTLRIRKCVQDACERAAASSWMWQESYICPTREEAVSQCRLGRSGARRSHHHLRTSWGCGSDNSQSVSSSAFSSTSQPIPVSRSERLDEKKFEPNHTNFASRSVRGPSCPSAPARCHSCMRDPCNACMTRRVACLGRNR